MKRWALRLLLTPVLAMGTFTGSLAGEPVYIDVRSGAEYSEGHIEGALLMPHSRIEELIATSGVAKDTNIILYCRSGRRAAAAQDALQSLGFSNVSNGGGYLEVAAKLEEQKSLEACGQEAC